MILRKLLEDFCRDVFYVITYSLAVIVSYILLCELITKEEAMFVSIVVMLAWIWVSTGKNSG